RTAEGGLDRGAAVAGVALDAPGHGGDRPGRIDAADAMVEGVGHVEGSVGRHVDTTRPVELGLGRRAAVAGEAGGAGAGDGLDGAGGVDPPDAVVERVGHVEVAGVVEGDALRVGKLRLDRGPAVARKSL